MFLRVEADGSMRWLRNVMYYCRSSEYHIAFHGIQAETNPHMRYRLHVSWWNSEVSKSLSANFEGLIWCCKQYESNLISNLIFLRKLNIVIPPPPCLLKMGEADPSTVELVNSVTPVYDNLFNFAIWAFASKCFCIELLQYSYGWRRTRMETIYIMPWLRVPWIPQCN